MEVTLTDTKREVSIVKDKRDARDLSSTKGRKRRLSDKENTDTWRRKKNKVSFRKGHSACFTYSHLCIERNRLPYQVSCWKKAVNGEDIYKDYLVSYKGHQYIDGRK